MINTKELKQKTKNKPLLPTAYSLFPIPYCLLPTAHSLLSIAYCLLPIAYCLLFLISCSAKDRFSENNTPPSKPNLIQHLGAVGDAEWLADTNNGIDSVSEEDWIRLQWDRLIDNDLKIIRIYRFAKDLNQSPVKIDSTLWNSTQYIDRFASTTLGDVSRLDTDWHYFIRAVNLANNFTDSDTVNFRLLQKPFLVYPTDGMAFESTSNIVFRWGLQGDSTRLRLLLFDENENLIWKYDEHIIISDTIYEKRYDGMPLPNGSYSWRIDSKGETDIENNIFSGSKSETRILSIR